MQDPARPNGQSSVREKMTQLATMRTWPTGLLARLETFLVRSDDARLFRMNPYRLAAELGSISPAEVIELCLFATNIGLFVMEWSLVCPACGDPVRSFQSLRTLESSFHCNMCDLDATASFDEYMKIDFTISPPVRSIAHHRPETLTVEQLYYDYHFSAEGRVAPGGALLRDVLRPATLALNYVEPGQTLQLSVTAGNDVVLMAYDALTGAMMRFTSDPACPAERFELNLGDKKITSNTATVRPTAMPLVVKNPTQTRKSLFLLQFTPEFRTIKPDKLAFDPYLTGRDLLTSQTFRDLFRRETITGKEGVTVKDICILFTDLKGSTEMYERIGDVPAFSLVRQHFDYLTRTIQRHRGAVVKTIGDAVMASFNSSVDAVRAANEMLTEIQKFNESTGGREIILKIGIHRGPLIAVTLNDSLDYFGQTVNIAARVQGLANAEETVITADVYSEPDVGNALATCKVESEHAQLKGVSSDVLVYRVRDPRVVPKTDATAPKKLDGAPALQASGIYRVRAPGDLVIECDAAGVINLIRELKRPQM